MQLYFTDLGALSRPFPLDDVTANLTPGALDVAERAELIDGMPFILMDDGSYDLDLKRFFRACPGMGARSPNTWRSYARDIIVWARFLAERRGSKTVWQADRHDVLAFHRARRPSAAPYCISAASWNRSIAALDKLYRWAVARRHRPRTPRHAFPSRSSAPCCAGRSSMSKSMRPISSLPERSWTPSKPAAPG